MENSTTLSETVAGEKARVDMPSNHEKGKVGRITEQSKGLFEDLQAWLELKLKIVGREFVEKAQEEAAREIKKKKMEILLAVAGGVGIVLGGLFLLISVALGIGTLLKHSGWGFLVVGSMLVVVAFVSLRVLKRRTRKPSAPTKPIALPEGEEPRQLTAVASPEQDSERATAENL